MSDNLGPRDLQSVPLKPGWREYFLFSLVEVGLNIYTVYACSASPPARSQILNGHSPTRSHFPIAA
jgi:hypothetical protein